jgi:predicted nucleic acid-binding Zn ribbon protein
MLQQRRCPACTERIADDALFCPACGADLSEKAHRSRLSKLNRKALYTVVAAGAVIVIGLVVMIAGTSGKRRAASVTADSLVAATARQRNDRASSEEQNSAAFRSTSKALVADYNRKIDDLFEKTARERKQLAGAKRLTDKSKDLLDQIESRIRDAKGAIGALEGAPNEDSRNGVQGAIDQKLAEARKMFGNLPH